MTVDDQGDARTKLKIKVRATCDDLWFIRLRFGCGWPQPSRHRHRVRLTVRTLLADGSSGTALRTTSSWPRDGAMAAIAHLHSPPMVNSEMSFTIDLDWPKRCAPLVDGTPDEFMVQYWQPVRRATYRVELPEGAEAYVEPVGISETFNGLRWRRKMDNNHRETITFKLSDLPIRHRAGVRLQLKESRRATGSQ
jgi:hypothetical protein